MFVFVIFILSIAVFDNVSNQAEDVKKEKKVSQVISKKKVSQKIPNLVVIPESKEPTPGKIILEKFAI